MKPKKPVSKYHMVNLKPETWELIVKQGKFGESPSDVIFRLLSVKK